MHNYSKAPGPLVLAPSSPVDGPVDNVSTVRTARFLNPLFHTHLGSGPAFLLGFRPFLTGIFGHLLPSARSRLKCSSRLTRLHIGYYRTLTEGRFSPVHNFHLPWITTTIHDLCQLQMPQHLVCQRPHLPEGKESILCKHARKQSPPLSAAAASSSASRTPGKDNTVHSATSTTPQSRPSTTPAPGDSTPRRDRSPRRSKKQTRPSPTTTKRTTVDEKTPIKALCRACKQISSIRRMWVHDMCQDCGKAGRTLTFYTILHLLSSVESINKRLHNLQVAHNSLFEIVHTRCLPAIEHLEIVNVDELATLAPDESPSKKV